jgi:hypothetical protein
MGIDELRKLCEKNEELGLDTLVLMMPTPKSWLKRGWCGPCVRSPFGIVKCYPNNNGITIFPTVKQVRKWIAKAEKQTFWKIVINEETREVMVGEFNEKTEKEIPLHGFTTTTRRFSSREEAVDCVNWAVAQITNDPEPSGESSP